MGTRLFSTTLTFMPMTSPVPPPSSAFVTLSSINQPLTFALLFLFFLSIGLGKKSCRPGLTITKRLCPSLVIMPIWTIVVLFTFVALGTVPDTKYADSEACNMDPMPEPSKNECQTRSLHTAYAGGLMAMGPFFLIAHLAMTYFRVSKGVTGVLFLLGALSFVGTGETTQSSAFFVSICIVFAALMTISLGRIIALTNVAMTEGLTSTNFNSTYFGTDPKCPFATWACCCEKKVIAKRL